MRRRESSRIENDLFSPFGFSLIVKIDTNSFKKLILRLGSNSASKQSDTDPMHGYTQSN